MKYNVQNLAFLSTVIAFASCQQHKQATIDESGNEVVKIRKPSEDTVEVAAPAEQTAPAAPTSETNQAPPPKQTQPSKSNAPAAPVKTEETVKPARAMTIKGVVKDINRGKDGYTARIETSDRQIVAATISRSNLYDPKLYREVSVGEVLKVTGNTWILDGVNQMTVRVIH